MPNSVSTKRGEVHSGQVLRLGVAPVSNDFSLTGEERLV